MSKLDWWLHLSIDLGDNNMPKKIFSSFYRSLKRDIISNYKIGDKYLTVRSIATKFDVSNQTAQKGISKLIDEGVLLSKNKVGTFVNKINTSSDVKNKKITVLSNKQDYHFYNGFFNGVKSVADEYNISTEMVFNTYGNTASLDFGKYLTEIETDGIIALSFINSALPFYYAMTHGVDIVSDIIIDELPILPAIQTDNYLHSRKAGEYLTKNGCHELYCIGFYPPGTKRERGFTDYVKNSNSSIKYIQLSAAGIINELNLAILNATFSTGFYICDYSSSYIFSSFCEQNNYIPRKGSVILYDFDQDEFESRNFSIPTVGPSFYELGHQLCLLLVNKWINGDYPAIIQKKI